MQRMQLLPDKGFLSQLVVSSKKSRQYREFVSIQTNAKQEAILVVISQVIFWLALTLEILFRFSLVLLSLILDHIFLLRRNVTRISLRDSSRPFVSSLCWYFVFHYEVTLLFLPS